MIQRRRGLALTIVVSAFLGGRTFCLIRPANEGDVMTLGITEAKQIARDAKTAINWLLTDDEEDAAGYRALAARVVDIVDDLVKRIRKLELEVEDLRKANEKQADLIANQNDSITYFEKMLERN